MKSLSIYIHIPFCAKKCDYCDFYSFAPKGSAVMDDYVDGLIKEIHCYEGELKDAQVKSVFIGGGTPSILGTERLVRILKIVMPDVSGEAEVTMECNPESVLDLDIAALMAAGINRFSMGVQSGSDRLLAIMGRIHDARTAKKAFYHLREGGARNINLDFIASVPGEGDEDIQKTIDMIDELSPEHISVYSLIVEEGTPFYERYYDKIDERDEEDRRHVHAYENALKDMGYEQYELSNFAKPGHECRHNLNYWHLGHYIGLGTAASGYLQGERYTNMTNIKGYLSAVYADNKPIAYREQLTLLDRDNEYMMLGIRLNEGIPLNGKIPSGGVFKDEYEGSIKRNLRAGLVKVCNGKLILTERGRDLSNQVELDFFRLGND